MIRAVGASVFFVFLMIAGWGSPDFFESIPQIILAGGLLVIPFFFPGGEPSGIQRGREQGESRLQFFIVVLLSTIGIAFWIPFFSGHRLLFVSLPEPLRYLGAFLGLVGYMIRMIAVRTLKRQFSYYVTIQESHQLITTGIYSMIRHPVYLGAILFVVGMTLVFPTWYGFLFVAIYFMLLAHRMSREEKLLLKYFGTVYQEYRSNSFRLIPHIY